MAMADVGIDPRAEAAARAGDAYDVRVLEPSPPAVDDGPFFADDPIAGRGAGTGRPVVSPVSSGDVLWDELCASVADPALAAWCEDRWLGPWRSLTAPPAALAPTRRAWQAVAEWVVAPARHAANGKIGLRYTRGGVGTPFFGDDMQVRVEGTDLVVVRGAELTRARLTTLAAAADFAGVAPATSTGVYEATTAWVPDEPLHIDERASTFLGDWYGFATSVLEELRASAIAPGDAPARVQLWPEHFDLAVDVGDADAGRRANYGASPGDAAHDGPYLYVGPWSDGRPGDGGYWNEAFGASLSLDAFVGAADQRAAALDFFRRGKELLDG